MNKKYITLLIGVIILLIIFVSFSIFLKREDEKNNFDDYEKNNLNSENLISEKIENKLDIDKDLQAVLSNTIEIEIMKQGNSTPNKSIDVEYPEFQNLDEEFQTFINAKIFNEINENTIYDNATEGYESGEIGFFTYEANYDRYNCDDYVSIVVNQYIHLGDGRPRMQKKCYVIDAQKNKIVSLADVMNDKTIYKMIILDEINRQAKDMNIELVGGNGLKTISDEQAFYIKDGMLVIYFEASEIAATAVGELEFIMPFKMIANKFII